MNISNGDMPASAFQQSEHDGDGQLDEYVNHLGLSKREHFAAMAMQGLCATYKPASMADDGSEARICATYALQHADALLKALSQEESGND